VQRLADASSLLSDSIDLGTTLQHILEIIVPSLGDCCFVHVTHKSGDVKALELRVRRPRSRCPRQAAPFHGYRAPSLDTRHARSRARQKAGVVDDERLNQGSFKGPRDHLMRGLPSRLQEYPARNPDDRFHATREPVWARDLLLYEEISRRAAAAIENSRLYHEAQEAIRMRDEFLSIASHELRPLDLPISQSPGAQSAVPPKHGSSGAPSGRRSDFSPRSGACPADDFHVRSAEPKARGAPGRAAGLDSDPAGKAAALQRTSRPQFAGARDCGTLSA